MKFLGASFKVYFSRAYFLSIVIMNQAGSSKDSNFKKECLQLDKWEINNNNNGFMDMYNLFVSNNQQHFNLAT